MPERNDDIVPSANIRPTPQQERKPEVGSVEFTASALSYRSPIPPPEILAGYNVLISPDAGNRILSMVERQEAHRQYLERTVIDGDNRRANVGLYVGGIIVLATIGLTAYLASRGQPLPGIGAIIVELSVLGGIFVYGSRQREQERRDRIALLANQQAPANSTEADERKVPKGPSRRGRS